MNNVDVLVVGAGPTGLVLASELRCHGADVRLVEARADRLNLSRSPGVHARTLELLDRHGLASGLISRGTSSHQTRLHVIGRHRKPRTLAGHGKRVPLEIGANDTRFPFLLMVSQTETEDILERHLERHGGRVERRTSLVDFEQDSDGVTARVRTADGTEETVRARFLVGADGVHSTVRQTLGVSFEGDSYGRSFLLADVHVDQLDHDFVHQFAGPTGLAILIPLESPAPWRFIAIESAAGAADEPSFYDVQRAASELSAGLLRLHDPVWISRFHVHRRLAARFRVGRVFLAGDAAHVHSPAGGQGMNTGMQDAWNLGWKLALVCSGRAPTALLDSYEAERVPVARFVLRFTDRIFAVQVSPNRLVAGLRNLLLRPGTTLLSRTAWLRRRVFRTMSQLDIRYPGSPAVVQAAPDLAPAAGARLPDTRLADGDWLHERIRPPHLHHLLVCGEVSDDGRLAELERAYAGLIVTHRLPVTVLGGGLVLVRPDGYVAYRGSSDLDGLETYLGRWLRPEASRRLSV